MQNNKRIIEIGKEIENTEAGIKFLNTQKDRAGENDLITFYKGNKVLKSIKKGDKAGAAITDALAGVIDEEIAEAETKINELLAELKKLV